MERKKPYHGIRTVRDWILFQYAAIMARSILESKGEIIKTKKELNKHFGLIISQYKDLESGNKHISDYFNDEKKAMKMDQECIYCGAYTGKLDYEHIIPRKIIGSTMADHSHNLVLSCKECNNSKSTKELISWWESKFGSDNLLRKHVLSKYLKFLYNLHQANGTLKHTWTEWDTSIFKSKEKGR